MGKKGTELSVADNWGADFLMTLARQKDEGAEWSDLVAWATTVDIRPLIDDPAKQSQYLRDLTTADKKVRKGAIKSAKEFDKLAEAGLEIIFRGLSLEPSEIIGLRQDFEVSANGVLAAVLKGENGEVLLQRQIVARQAICAKYVARAQRRRRAV